MKSEEKGRHQWLTSLILPNLEAEIEWLEFKASPGK
jgi:hypothetical protein